MTNRTPQADRVLILAPSGRDAELCAAVLSDAGVSCAVQESVLSLCREVEQGCGAILVAEEALQGPALAELTDAVTRQPAWSDLPIVVILLPGKEHASAVEQWASRLGNVTLVDRPLRVHTLLSVIQVALRGRSRQYEIREHLAELQRTEESLRQANAVKDEFLGFVSHEMRTPLTVLRGNAEMLVRQFDHLDRDLLEGSVSEILARADHLQRMVENMLKLSKVESGSVLLAEPILLQRSFDSLCRGQSALYRRPITCSVPDDVPPVLADPTYLDQVMQNLLSNARKYSPEGASIDVAARHEGTLVRVVVSDHGAGLPDSEIEHLFEPFYRAPGSMTRAAGIGLGLAVSKRLIEAMGGSINATHRPGGGMDFAFTLPLAPDDDEPAAGAREAAVLAGGLPGEAPAASP